MTRLREQPVPNPYQVQPKADIRMRDTGSRRSQKHDLSNGLRETHTKHTNGYRKWEALNASYDGTTRRAFQYEKHT